MRRVERVVGMSEFLVSADPSDVLVTYSLGSCIGLVLWDSHAGIAGLLHAQMPASKSNPTMAAETPAKYVDTGVLALLQAMFNLGARRDGLVAKIAGAASQVDHEQLFRIGERNHTVLRKVLWKNGIFIEAEDIGGGSSRTVCLDAGTGRTIVKSDGEVREL